MRSAERTVISFGLLAPHSFQHRQSHRSRGLREKTPSRKVCQRCRYCSDRVLVVPASARGAWPTAALESMAPLLRNIRTVSVSRRLTRAPHARFVAWRSMLPCKNGRKAGVAMARRQCHRACAMKEARARRVDGSRHAAARVGLRYTTDDRAGIRRERHAAGFVYVSPRGRRAARCRDAGPYPCPGHPACLERRLDFALAR